MLYKNGMEDNINLEIIIVILYLGILEKTVLYELLVLEFNVISDNKNNISKKIHTYRGFIFYISLRAYKMSGSGVSI